MKLPSDAPGHSFIFQALLIRSFYLFCETWPSVSIIVLDATSFRHLQRRSSWFGKIKGVKAQGWRFTKLNTQLSSNSIIFSAPSTRKYIRVGVNLCFNFSFLAMFHQEPSPSPLKVISKMIAWQSQEIKRRKNRRSTTENAKLYGFCTHLVNIYFIFWMSQ